MVGPGVQFHPYRLLQETTQYRRSARWPGEGPEVEHLAVQSLDAGGLEVLEHDVAQCRYDMSPHLKPVVGEGT